MTRFLITQLSPANRHGRFRDGDLFRQIFEAVVRACMDASLVKDAEAFAVDASVSGSGCRAGCIAKAPDEIDWSAPERQTRAVAEFLGALDDEDPDADPQDAEGDFSSGPVFGLETANVDKRVQFGYGLNYLIDIEHAIVVDVEATPAPHLRRGPGDQDDDRAHRRDLGA